MKRDENLELSLQDRRNLKCPALRDEASDLIKVRTPLAYESLRHVRLWRTRAKFRCKSKAQMFPVINPWILKTCKLPQTQTERTEK